MSRRLNLLHHRPKNASPSPQPPGQHKFTTDTGPTCTIYCYTRSLALIKALSRIVPFTDGHSASLSHAPPSIVPLLPAPPSNSRFVRYAQVALRGGWS